MTPGPCIHRGPFIHPGVGRIRGPILTFPDTLHQAGGDGLDAKAMEVIAGAESS